MRQLATPFLVIAVLLSLLGNAFFVFERREHTLPARSERGEENTNGDNVDTLAPQAFGTVTLSPLPVLPDACASLLKGAPAGNDCFALQSAQRANPIHEREEGTKSTAMTQLHFDFSSSGAVLPSLGETLPLYRERGVGINFSEFGSMLKHMGFPIDLRRRPIVARELSFTTVDGLFTISASLFSRVITIKRIAASSSSRLVVTEVPAEKDIIEATAAFASSFGIDIAAYPAPTIVNLPEGSTSKNVKRLPSTVDVLWPMEVDGTAVIDAAGAPVPALRIRYSIAEKRPLSLVFRPFYPPAFAASAYPVISAEAFAVHAESGGLLPPPSFPRGKNVSVSYASPRLAYLLSEDPKQTLATYLVPVVVVDIVFPASCDACQGKTWKTLLPALRDGDVMWQKK